MKPSAEAVRMLVISPFYLREKMCGGGSALQQLPLETAKVKLS